MTPADLGDLLGSRPAATMILKGQREMSRSASAPLPHILPSARRCFSEDRPMEKIPLLLDTDPGSDIDDAVAISYLLRQPRCRTAWDHDGERRRESACGHCRCPVPGGGAGGCGDSCRGVGAFVDRAGPAECAALRRPDGCAASTGISKPTPPWNFCGRRSAAGPMRSRC